VPHLGHKRGAKDGTNPRPAALVRAPDETSRAWLTRLHESSPEHDIALAELHGLLLKAARFTLARRRPLASDVRERLDDLASEVADEALVAVLAHLADYRGESRFTTWAWKFAVVQASVALRRRAWAARELPAEDDVWQAVSRDPSPETRLEQQELLAAIKVGVETALSAHQRAVFVAVALNEVPIDVLAERMRTTRGALYKTLHDARHNLRAYLAASCLAPEISRAAQAPDCLT
jgi:RNA polymerase sigma-70 factor (ECF subfamily)